MKWLALGLISLLALVLLGCTETPPPPAPKPVPSAPSSARNLSAFAPYLSIKAYTDLSLATQAAQELDHAISKLLYAPSTETLADARMAWRKAYDRYLATLIYTRLPLSDPEEWTQQNLGYQQTLVQLDSWPIEPGYIDYVPDYPFSGIVNDLALPLNPESLLGEHLLSAPNAASIGFPALEFMLWSVDGQRAWQDFIAQENTAPGPQNNNEGADAIDNTEVAPSLQVQNHQRRRQYLRLLSEGIHKQLQRLERRFEPSTGHYATELKHADPANLLRATLRATQKIFGDELPRRLNTPSSTFSHSTSADLLALIAGVDSLLLPKEESSYGLAKLLAEKDQALVDAWQTQLAEIKTTVQKLAENSKEGAQQQLQLQQQSKNLLDLVLQSAKQLGIALPSTPPAD